MVLSQRALSVVDRADIKATRIDLEHVRLHAMKYGNCEIGWLEGVEFSTKWL